MTTLALITGAVVPDRALDHRLSRDNAAFDALVVGGAAIGAIRTVSPTSGGTVLGLAGRF